MAHPDVSDSIFSIIAAFTSGLDVFKKVRDRRGKQKSKKGAKADKKSGEELKLSQSLRQGPRDIQHEYDRSYAALGERFAKGDAIAHASLTSTLVKLNSGIVNIISTFLGNGKKDLRLDYRSLTDLSEKSRVEAVRAMAGLSDRLSQSSLMLFLTCRNCGSSKHTDCHPIREKIAAPKSSNGRSKKRRAQPKTIDGTTVARVNLSANSEPMLAMVRPRARRTTSSSSASSVGTSKTSSNPSTAVTTPATSPLASPQLCSPPLSPPPRYTSPIYPTQPHTVRSSETRPPSYHSSAPWSNSGRAPPKQSPPPVPARPNRRPPPVPQPPAGPPAEDEVHELPTPTVIPHAVARRRLDKATPSFQSFASDSTKLGEIPMHKWAVPYDFAAMERRNREAIESGDWPGNVVTPPERRGRRLFGLFKKGGNGK